MAIWHIGAGKAPIVYNLSSDIETSSGKAVTGRCIFRGAVIKTDGTNNVTVTFYDNTEASGDKILDTMTIYGPVNTAFIGSIDKMCANGVYVSISGGTFSWQVLYDN